MDTTALETTRVKGRILDVLINADEPKHVVAYVRWKSSAEKDVVKEAATIGGALAKEMPFVSTLSLSAIHPKAEATSKKSIWSGKISRTGMERINPARIEDYADRLYGRLFEKVKDKQK